MSKNSKAVVIDMIPSITKRLAMRIELACAA